MPLERGSLVEVLSGDKLLLNTEKLDWSYVLNKYILKRKEKNKSREEIFYQMKVFFC